MRTHVILAESWPSMEKAVADAQKYLGIFGVTHTSERRSVDISSPSAYETSTSNSKLEKGETKSIARAFILSLPSPEKMTTHDCFALLVDKEKALYEKDSLRGQQSTFKGKQVIEVYCKDNSEKLFGLDRNSYVLIHEELHALADHYDVEDTLHKYLDGKPANLDAYRETLLDEILAESGGMLPLVYEKTQALVEFAKTKDIAIRITEGYRSPARQNALYAQGRTKPGNIVTYAKAWESIHQYRSAIDIVFRKGGYDVPAAQWKVIADYAKLLGFNWGGDWPKEKRDMPHFELTFGKTFKDFQNRAIDWRRYYQPEPTLFKHDFKKEIKYGDNSAEVVALQKALQIEGSFPVTQNATGLYGDITRRAVLSFQVKYKVAPLSELNSLAGKLVGVKTRAQLNKLFKV